MQDNKGGGQHQYNGLPASGGVAATTVFLHGQPDEETETATSGDSGSHRQHAGMHK
jgi:hypothetical protein